MRSVKCYVLMYGDTGGIFRLKTNIKNSASSLTLALQRQQKRVDRGIKESDKPALKLL